MANRKWTLTRASIGRDRMIVTSVELFYGSTARASRAATAVGCARSIPHTSIVVCVRGRSIPTSVQTSLVVRLLALYVAPRRVCYVVV